MDDNFYVSENAWKNGGAGSGGSTMFAKVKSEVPPGGPHPGHHRAVGQ